MTVEMSEATGTRIPASFFDRGRLSEVAERLAPTYQNAQPFPHIVIDDFVDEEALDRVVSEFPAPPARSHGGLEVKKSSLADEMQLGPFTRHYLAQFNSAVFLEFLESLTGISGLVADPHYLGGGLHQTETGGFLKVHADFNKHKHLKLDRRLNLILYLNRDWKEEWGGHLELWNRDMSKCEAKVAPRFNRCVIFNTTDFSYHGHPDPLTCPEGITRKSIALYYYSNGRPAEEVSSEHSTLFRARPGEVMRRPPAYVARTIAENVLPPIVFKGLAAAAKRRRGGPRWRND